MKKQKQKELPKILVVSNKIVREVWWRKTHLKAIKPSSVVVVHKSQVDVPKTHIRVRYGVKKDKIVMLRTEFFKTLKGKEFKK